jgi:ATP-dependent DNA helicase PIF1
VALCVTNAQADDVNALGESNIPGPSYRFEASVGGCFPEDIWPTRYFLDLKIGSRIMLLANDWSWIEGGYHVNGDIGLVADICPERGAVEVALDDGRRGWVYRHEWHNVIYRVEFNPISEREEVVETIIGTFGQMPLRLAHAVTIHKSQGLTLDRMHLVLGHRGPFAGGHLYTALSRCRSLRGLSLDRPLRVDDVLVDPRVHQFQASITAGMPVPAAEKRTPVPALI